MNIDKKIIKELHKLNVDFELIELFECIADNGETEYFLDAVDRYMQALCDAEYLGQLQTRCKFTQDEIEDLHFYLKVIYHNNEGK